MAGAAIAEAARPAPAACRNLRRFMAFSPLDIGPPTSGIPACNFKRLVVRPPLLPATDRPILRLPRRLESGGRPTLRLPQCSGTVPTRSALTGCCIGRAAYDQGPLVQKRRHLLPQRRHL